MWLDHEMPIEAEPTFSDLKSTKLTVVKQFYSGIKFNINVPLSGNKWENFHFRFLVGTSEPKQTNDIR